jgi:hypothetical protein
MKPVNHSPEHFTPRVDAPRRASAMKGLPNAPDLTAALNRPKNTRRDSPESKPRPRREARFADESVINSPISTIKSPSSGTSSISHGVTQQPREQYPREPSVRSKMSNKSSKSGKAGSIFRSNGKSLKPTSNSPRPPFLSAHSESAQFRGGDSSYNSASSVAASTTSGSTTHLGTNGNSTKPSITSPIIYGPDQASINGSGTSTPKVQRPSMDNFAPPLLAPTSQRGSPKLYSPATSSKLSLPSTSIASITKLDQSSERAKYGLKFFRNPFHRK